MAQHPQTKPVASPTAIAPRDNPRDNPALSKAIAAYEAQTLESQLDAHNFMHGCLREDEECRRAEEAQAAARAADDLAKQQTAEQQAQTVNRIAEGVELLVAAPVAGVVSLWETGGGKRIGRGANIVLGLAAKGVSAFGIGRKIPAVEVATRASKVLVHSQVSIDIRDFVAKKWNKENA